MKKKSRRIKPDKGGIPTRRKVKTRETPFVSRIQRYGHSLYTVVTGAAARRLGWAIGTPVAIKMAGAGLFIRKVKPEEQERIKQAQIRQRQKVRGSRAGGTFSNAVQLPLLREES